MKRCLLVGVILLVVAAGFAFATRDDRDKKTVVVATRPLARYAVVTADDVEVRQHDIEGGHVLTRPTAAIGKVLLEPVAEGEPVLAPKLVKRSLVDGRVPLTVVATASTNGPDAGKQADLVVSPRNEKGGSVVVCKVTVLAVTKAKEAVTYTVGVTEADRLQLAPLLGFSDVRVTPPSISPP